MDPNRISDEQVNMSSILVENLLEVVIIFILSSKKMTPRGIISWGVPKNLFTSNLFTVVVKSTYIFVIPYYCIEWPVQLFSEGSEFSEFFLIGNFL